MNNWVILIQASQFFDFKIYLILSKFLFHFLIYSKFVRLRHSASDSHCFFVSVTYSNIWFKLGRIRDCSKFFVIYINNRWSVLRNFFYKFLWSDFRVQIVFVLKHWFIFIALCFLFKNYDFLAWIFPIPDLNSEFKIKVNFCC